ncbi:pentatricopeptide repeat-containing protein At1g71490 isoform X2 [Asparagus officinalis]|uniref:pentatricopeptide repeat-containing protein At1g71490 isoform X2 n=1 Tax=Asparagus officinalis TaxID=4686 RepID=UPI00098E089C|nr:pentatricopeptide repeat-containing protein At1g71490 isoform X2 [Asparagus officinalis]
MAGNAMSGEKIFMSKCAQCHNLDRGGGAAQKQGPNLNGLFGRRFGACPEYLFTSENKNSTLVWEESALPEHLLDSNKCIPGTKTNFPGLGKQQDCIDLTDYLKQQKKTSLSVPSAVISSKNNLSQIQSYIIRSWKESVTLTPSNFPRRKVENEKFRYPTNHQILLLIGSIRSLSMEGQISEAFKSFSVLQHRTSSSIIFLHPISSLLSVATNLKALPQGKQLHAQIIFLGLHGNSFLISRLSSFYSTVSLISDAKTIVEDSSTKHALPWNLLISAYAQNGFWPDAVLAYKKMVERGCEVDKFAFPSILRACSEILVLDLGRAIHGSIVIRGYSSKGMCVESLDLLEKMQLEESKTNTVTWNTIATANLQMGRHLEALELISKMRIIDSSIDSASLVIGLNSCSKIGFLRLGKEIHGLALRLHYNELENVSNALITMYSRCKQVEVAHLLFGMKTYKSLITWNAMIAGFAFGDQEEETFATFQEMIRSQIQPNYVTAMIIFSLCTRATNLQYGRELHCYIIKHMHSSYQLLCNSLIDMYSKLGRIRVAEKVFDMMSDCDGVSYTSMIAGYGIQGEGMKALDLFDKMISCGIMPDGFTMVAILSACSHSGMITEGETLFWKMNVFYGISPQMEHYSCMVDLFGRAGLLRNAEEFIDQMPFEPSTAVLATLIRACRAHGSKEIGERAAKRLLEMTSDDPNHYVLIANMFAYCGNWEQLMKVRAVMKDMGIVELHILLGGLFQHMQDVGYADNEDLGVQ